MSGDQRTFASALARLPHGPEFRFRDRRIRLVPGEEGAGVYTIRGDEPFLKGHFPGNPIFPGVLLLEAAAQLVGVVAQSDPRTSPLPNLRLTAIRGVKITGTAGPGEVLTIQGSITGRLGNLVQADASVQVNSRTILTAQLTLSGTIG